MTATPSPPHAALLRDFVNTVDVETSVETLTDPTALGAWLQGHDLLAEDVAPTDDDLALALLLRRGLRAAMSAHHDGREAGEADLSRAAEALPLRLVLDDDGPSLRPTATGAPGALGRIVAAVTAAGADGSWPRLKLCEASDCRWAFHDLSKNHSRTWCDMGVCGNRRKTRAYRARRRAPT